MNSSEHDSLVRRWIEAWNDNDWAALESIWHPEGQIVAPEGWPESGEFIGWPAVRDQFARLKDPWTAEDAKDISIEPQGERVLAYFRWVAQGQASGASLDVDVWMLCEFREGRIFRIRYYTNEKEARTAGEAG
jgi:ketosteroid isomerase-like protein